jgi:hypothetical protein
MTRYAIIPVFLMFFCMITGCEKDLKNIGGYLFAHMMKDDYGSLYYSLSQDGVNWMTLNEGKRIDSAYRGHPDICKGRDGEYYMIGVERQTLEPVLWRTEDLLHWKAEKHLSSEVFLNPIPGYQANPLWYGAPKMYFDESADQYLITWHASREGTGDGPERWKSMRTFYVLSHDLDSFTEPARLFDFESEADRSMATIDVIIRKSGDLYFAMIKDERWPEDTETGKTIRISFSKNLTGPYSNPGPPITPPWHEAPSIVPSRNHRSWMMYAENYPHRYAVFTADSLDGQWKQEETNLENVRHGCVITVNSRQYARLLSGD